MFIRNYSYNFSLINEMMVISVALNPIANTEVQIVNMAKSGKKD